MSKELELEQILLRKRRRESKLKDFKNIIFALNEEGFSRARICEILAENYPESEEFFTLSRLTSFMLSPRNHIQMSKKEAAQILASLKFDSEKKEVERQNSHRARKYHDEIVALVGQGYSRSIIAEYLSKKYGESLTYSQINFYVTRYIQGKSVPNPKNGEERTRSHVSYKSYHDEIFEYVNAGFSMEDTLTALQEAHPEEENFTLANLRAYIKRATQKEQQSPKADLQTPVAKPKVNDVIHGKVGTGEVIANNSISDFSEQVRRNNAGGNAFGGLSQETDKV